MTVLLEAKQLAFRYQSATPWLFKDINMALHGGEIIVIAGPSGVGKSTFARCLCGIIPQVFTGELQGEVHLLGKTIAGLSLPQISLHLGYVFQEPEYQLFSHTVIDEIAFGLENLCLPPQEIDRRIEQILGLFNMESYRLAHPQELSGGQQQRIALAAVLAMQPRILVCDEVMAPLDVQGRQLIKNILLQQRAQGNGIIMIEHQRDSWEIADQILLLNEGCLQPY